MGGAGILEDTSEIFTAEYVNNNFLELPDEEDKNSKSETYVFDIHLPIR